MSLTIEDGSGVVGANSYATPAQAIAYCAARGLTFPSVDADVEKLLVKACDYLETLNWKGTQVDPVTPQTLAWPRAGIFFGPPAGSQALPTEFPNDSIPQKVLDAQCRLAYDATLYPDLITTGEGRQIIAEKVDVLEVHYSDTKSGTVQPRFNAALGILKDFLNGNAFGLTTKRV